MIWIQPASTVRQAGREVHLALGESVGEFVSDFVWCDRRLAIRSDIEVVLLEEPRLRSNVRIYDEPFYSDLSAAKIGGVRLCDPITYTSLEIRTNTVLKRDEQRRLRLLASIAMYCTVERSDRLRFSPMIGPILKDIRTSLGLTQEDTGSSAHTGRLKLSRWETGEQAPDLSALYRWCQALGLVCAPNTALVRTVDFSPQLLRFLQEDPTRLRSLTPEEFEHLVAERLDRMGYSVTLTGPTNRKDGGIDLVAVPRTDKLGSVVIAGQIKHHRGDQTTGVEAVDRLLAWKDSVFRAGLLVTNTSFTKDAVWKATKDGNNRFLKLRDFIDLKRWLQDEYGTDEDWREIPDRIELAPGVVIEIPKPRIISPFDFKAE